MTSNAPGVGISSPQSAVDTTDDLRRWIPSLCGNYAHKVCSGARTGKISLWPYAAREVPSPVESVRLELESASCLPAPLVTDQGPATVPLGGQGDRLGVQYFPACLVRDEAIAASLQLTRPPCRRPGINASGAGIVEGGHRDKGYEGDADGTNVVEPGGNFRNHKAPSQSRGTRNAAGFDRCATSRRPIPRSLVGRPASSGPHDRRPRGSLARAMSTIMHGVSRDRVECPLGCGEEICIKDVLQHESFLCAMRYVECLMPGCPTLVQAGSLESHLKRECMLRRKQRILAAKGKALENRVTCEDCKEIVVRKNMREHRAGECDARMVPCPNPGCGDFVQARALDGHKRNHCKHRTWKPRTAATIESSKVAGEMCPMCHETLTSRSLRKHVANECPSRIVACPNNGLGCQDKLTASDLPRHLRDECHVRLERAERASRHALRRQRAQCPACGYMVLRQNMANHQHTKCPNRRIPCKNWELGCPAILRLSAMDDHLRVDRLLDPRSCLVFDGGTASVALGEDDIKPPWTVEFWLWRPGLAEGTREKARTALKAYWEFQVSRGMMAAAEGRLRVLEPLLIESATRASRERSSEAEKTREQVTDEMVRAATCRDDAKVNLVVSTIIFSNSLASATRGIEELGAQDRPESFERLALGSSPWYGAIPARTSAETLDHERDRGVPAADAQEAAGSHPHTLARSALEASHGTTATSSGLALSCDENSPNEHECATPSEVKSQQPLAPDGAEPSEGVARDHGQGSPVLNITDALSAIMKEQEALGKAEYEEGQKRGALFWAEWGALSGHSLARRLRSLAAETVPVLLKEVATMTDLSMEDLFHGEVEPDPNTATDSAKRDDRGESTSLPKKPTQKHKKAARKARRRQKHEEQFGKKITARIAEEVGRRGNGTGTLFGSKHARFQLEMGAKDRVGITIAGKSDHVFNYRCPRERWVHLSFACDSGGVVLLEDANVVSRLASVSVHLPMEEIGGGDTACQCLLQEVRYWRVKRTTEELGQWLHHVLPRTAVDAGLLGYWTMEEGAGAYVHDVTEQRVRKRKLGSGLNWGRPETMTNASVGPAPTPSWREQNVCKVELRRGRLAQRGRFHQQYVSCSKGCGETFLRRNAKAHEAYRCPLRVVTCHMAGCDMEMLQRDVARHLKEECVPYGIWLRMAEAGEENQELSSCASCGDTVKRCKLHLHRDYFCKWVKELCRNDGCSAFVPRIRRDEHEQRFCQAPCAVRRRKVLARARARSQYVRDWAQDEE